MCVIAAEKQHAISIDARAAAAGAVPAAAAKERGLVPQEAVSLAPRCQWLLLLLQLPQLLRRLLLLSGTPHGRRPAPARRALAHERRERPSVRSQSAKDEGRSPLFDSANISKMCGHEYKRRARAAKKLIPRLHCTEGAGARLLVRLCCGYHTRHHLHNEA